MKNIVLAIEPMNFVLSTLSCKKKRTKKKKKKKKQIQEIKLRFDRMRIADYLNIFK